MPRNDATMLDEGMNISVCNMIFLGNRFSRIDQHQIVALLVRCFSQGNCIFYCVEQHDLAAVLNVLPLHWPVSTRFRPVRDSCTRTGCQCVSSAQCIEQQWVDKECFR